MPLSLKDEFDALSKYTHMLEGNGRITSADIAHLYDNSQVHQRLDIASNAMTTNKPAGDGFINTYFWDNNGKHNAQIWFPNNISINGGHPQVRYQGGSDTWSAWTNLALAKDFNGSMYIGTCDTAAATAAKAVTVSSDQNFALKKGAIVAVKFTNTNSASTPTINVNSTGAKNVWYNNASYTGTSNWIGGYASKYTYYVYDGAYWCWLSMGSESDTTYSTMSVSEGTTGTATSARTMRADYLKQIIQSYINTSKRFFRELIPDGTAIPSNANLQTATYLKVGKFSCPATATAATLTNCPVSEAFMMEVFSPLSDTVDNETTDPWVYRIRKITDLYGNVWTQYVHVGATAGTYTWGTWTKFSFSNIRMTNTDPGAGSALAANGYVAVYGNSDGTIESSDINWTQMPNRTFHIYGTVPESDVDHTIVSPLGRTYTYRVHNGGTGVSIVSGAQNIVWIRATMSAQYSTAIAGNIGIQGRSKETSSSWYVRIYSRANNGVWASNVQGATPGDGTNTYSDFLLAAGAKIALQYEYTAIHYNADSTNASWRIIGKLGASGVLETASFEGEGSAANASCAPCLYQRGAQPSNVGTVWYDLEIFEKP